MNREIKSYAIKKAMQSSCVFKVSAIALNHKGDVIGSAVNSKLHEGRGRGLHAEINLIRKVHGIKTIIICRVGNAGDIRPIRSCPACQNICDRLGIKVITIA